MPETLLCAGAFCHSLNVRAKQILLSSKRYVTDPKVIKLLIFGSSIQTQVYSTPNLVFSLQPKCLLYYRKCSKLKANTFLYINA